MEDTLFPWRRERERKEEGWRRRSLRPSAPSVLERAMSSCPLILSLPPHRPSVRPSAQLAADMLNQEPSESSPLALVSHAEEQSCT